jgi:hypothetical protein
MAINRDYIPGPDAEFASWFDNLVRQVGLHTSGAAPDWTHIPADDVTELMESHGRWQLAYQEAQDDPTPSNIREKTRVRDKEEKDVIRPFVRDYLHSRQVTDKQRDDLGVSNHDPTKTPAPTPDAGPESRTHASPASPGVVEVSYLGAKPYGVERIEAAYAVADEPIADFALLTERDTFSHNPLKKRFLERRGKTLSYSLRYLLADSESEWSKIESVVIP